MSSQVSLNNLLINVETRMSAELEAWRSGEKHWGVSNQFDEYYLESAIENCNIETLTAKVKELEGADLFGMSAMSWAHQLSTFEVSDIPNFD